MSWTRSVRRLADQGTLLRDKVQFLAPLATRITIGLGFHQAGTGKLENLERTTAFFMGLGLPAPGVHALLIGGLETIGGIALLLGLATRPVAALLCCTMLVALGTAERETFLAAWGSASETAPTDIAAFVFLLLTSWLFFHGAGAASLDAALTRVLRRSPDTIPPTPAVAGNH